MCPDNTRVSEFEPAPLDSDLIPADAQSKSIEASRIQAKSQIQFQLIHHATLCICVLALTAGGVVAFWKAQDDVATRYWIGATPLIGAIVGYSTGARSRPGSENSAE